MRKSFIPVIGLGPVGTVLAVYAYLSLDTGAAGTFGALLALIGAIAVTVGSLVAALADLRGWVFGVLAFLIALGAALTALAGYFLMQHGLAAVMALVLPHPDMFLKNHLIASAECSWWISLPQDPSLGGC